MALKGKFLVRTKINIDNNISEQTFHFSYLGNYITYTFNRPFTLIKKNAQFKSYKAVEQLTSQYRN
jgi:hypothetical protein